MNQNNLVNEVKENPLGKVSCSPEVDMNKDEIFEYAIPERVSWGEALPICVFLKLKPQDHYYNFRSRAYITSGEPIRHNTSWQYNFGDGVSDLFTEDIPDELSRNHQIYYNFLAITDRILPPGVYELALDANDGLQNTHDRKRSFEIVEGGWLKEYAEMVTDLVSDTDFKESMNPYIQELAMAKVETPAGPDGLKHTYERLAKLWGEGFASSRSKLSKELLEEISKADYDSDNSVGWVVFKRLKDKAIKTDIPLNVWIDDLISGIRNYEVEITRQ